MRPCGVVGYNGWYCRESQVFKRCAVAIGFLHIFGNTAKLFHRAILAVKRKQKYENSVNFPLFLP